MKPTYKNGNVAARCPDCGTVTTFEYQHAKAEFGTIIVNGNHNFEGQACLGVAYKLLRCAGCGRGGIAKIHYGHGQDAVRSGKLETFYPTSIERAKLPLGVPPGVEAEFREAELCASVSAWRGASGLLRSTLEKILRANGYDKGNLQIRIDQASADGVITEARRKRAHEDIRVLGNDVLHDEWRVVTPEEVALAHHYAQRIAEDFYDDRPSVEAILKTKGRLKP